MINLLKRGIRGSWFWLWGHFFAFFLYDKKYLRGRWFDGKFKGLCAKGWEWVTIDALTKIFLHENKEARFPVGYQTRVICPNNIDFDCNDLNNFQSTGVYIQAIGQVKIGKGTYIAPNVGIITSNHAINNLDNHDNPKEVIIGDKCWIGMNSVILPGVHLGNHTIVGAGSIVTKSFEDGNCVIVGNPARIIKLLIEEKGM